MLETLDMKLNVDPVFARLFPDFVVTVEADPHSIEGTLFDEEESLVQDVVEKRRREFTAGRLCAREALSRLGIDKFPLLIGENRAPLWPDAVTGSISHTSECCGVVAAQRNKVSGLGLDMEVTERVKPKLWSMIFVEAEVAWLKSLNESDRMRYATLLFSAKECFYKCQYTFTRQWLGFMDASVEADLDRSSFMVTLLSDECRKFQQGRQVEGSYLFHKDLVYTGICMLS